MSVVLQEALEQEAEGASKELMKEIRDEYVSLLENEDQGADGLTEFVTDVKQSRDSSGRFEDGFEFDVEHPFADLHEKGGHIEPTYGRAAAMGWERDEMYQALEDCNEYVRRKGTLMKAVDRVKSDFS